MLWAILNKSWRQHPIKHQPSQKLSKLDKPEKLISDVFLWSPSHGRTKSERQAHTYSSSVGIWGVSLGTFWKWWMMGRGGERRSGISMLMARRDDDYQWTHQYWPNSNIIRCRHYRQSRGLGMNDDWLGQRVRKSQKNPFCSYAIMLYSGKPCGSGEIILDTQVYIRVASNKFPGIKNCRRHLKIHYVIAIHLMKWQTNLLISGSNEQL